MIYEKLIKPILFSMPPEQAHEFTVEMLHKFLGWDAARGKASHLFEVNHPLLETEAFGIKFKNPVGLAAGFDKDAHFVDEISTFGFGFLEVGTVTPKPQDGNPQPRLFRLPPDEALINRMGFNNKGLEAMVARLKKRKTDLVIGGNIGKNKVTPNENAVNDYLLCFESLFPHVEYFTVNVSSPNTPNLRELQEKGPLLALLGAIQEKNQQQNKPKPILLKIAPDLTDSQLDDIVEIVRETKIQGVIATNTTIDRSNLKTSETRLKGIGNGGLSGKPLTNRATEVIRYLSNKGKGDFVIVGVGGIMTPQDAIEKLEAGAHLLQVYTGFVYKGPWLVKDINKAILKYRKL